jgi:hypothetical protein
MISLSIKTYEIEPEHIIIGKNGKIVSVVLFENKDGRGKYGDDGFAVQGVSKELRDKGVRGKIIGNWRYTGQGANAGGSGGNRNNQPEDADNSDVPF